MAPLPEPPDFPGGGLLAGASGLSRASQLALAGIVTAEDTKRFEGELVLLGTRRAVSLFGSNSGVYAVLEAGCLEDGQLVLEGHWRYPAGRGIGLVRLSAEPRTLAARLCRSDLTGISLAELTLTGLTSSGDGELQDPVRLTFARPLNDPERRFLIGGHRGACRTSDVCGASENSVASILLAEAMGANGIELDVQLTKDRIPVLYHDLELGPRLTLGPLCSGPVADYTLDDLRALCTLLGGEPIPTLGEALRAVIDETDLLAVWLDVKTPEAMQAVLDAVQVHSKIAELRGHDLRLVVGITDGEQQKAFLAAQPPPGTPCLIETGPGALDRTGCKIWGPRWTRGPMSADVALVQAEGGAVVFWTIDELETIDLFLRDAKPNGILSNHPALVRQRYQLLGSVPSGALPR